MNPGEKRESCQYSRCASASGIGASKSGWEAKQRSHTVLLVHAADLRDDTQAPLTRFCGRPEGHISKRA